MRERVDMRSPAFAAARSQGQVDDVASSLGMGGSRSLRRCVRTAFGEDRFSVLDTTHPKAIRRLLEALDLEAGRSSSSHPSPAGRCETRSHFELFWERGRTPLRVITDPGSPLEPVPAGAGAQLFAGEPTIGGRYSALSPFGLVPAALMRRRPRPSARPAPRRC